MIPDPQKRNRRKAGVPFLRVRKGFGERLCQNAMQKVVFMVK